MHFLGTHPLFTRYSASLAIALIVFFSFQWILRWRKGQPAFRFATWKLMGLVFGSMIAGEIFAGWASRF